MREILFCAKRKNWRELSKEEWWVEGYYCYFMNEHCILPKNLDADAALFGEQKVFVIIDSETLGQYTGLKDKNGNRIWENDIVSINTYSYEEPEEDYFGKVVYAGGWACWCIQQPDDEKPIPLCECEGSYQTDRIIEGNIFDNPELLKGDIE